MGGTVAVESINKVSLACENAEQFNMRDTWLTIHNSRGHLYQGKKAHFIEKTETIKGNESAEDHLSKDLADQVIVYVLKYVCLFLCFLISCTGLDPTLFELGCLGPSVSITVILY